MNHPHWKKEYLRIDFHSKMELIEDIKRYLLSPLDNKQMLYELSEKYKVSTFTVADNARKLLKRLGYRTRVEYMYHSFNPNQKESNHGSNPTISRSIHRTESRNLQSS